MTELSLELALSIFGPVFSAIGVGIIAIFRKVNDLCVRMSVEENETKHHLHDNDNKTKDNKSK